MKLIFFMVFSLLIFDVSASKKAVTEEGDVVILNDNGTWVYEDKVVEKAVQLTMNSQLFSTHPDSKFQIKSNKTNAAFWIDPKKWSFTKNEGGEAAEYSFKLKNGDLYAMAITEQLEIDVEKLSEVAVDNARDAAPDIRVTKKEYRMVNGLKVIYMEMEGTIQSIKFTYIGHYFSDESGSVQYLTYTGSNLVQKYRTDIDRFLNGLNIQP